MEKLNIANLKVNLYECAFAQEEVVVLVSRVSKHGINPNPAKVQGISDLRQPKDVSGVKQILGMFKILSKIHYEFY